MRETFRFATELPPDDDRHQDPALRFFEGTQADRPLDPEELWQDGDWYLGHDTVALEPGWVDRHHVRIPSLREHAHRGGLQLAVSVHGAAATVFTLEEYNRRLEHEAAHTAHLAAQSEAQWRAAQSQGPLPGSDSDGSD